MKKWVDRFVLKGVLALLLLCCVPCSFADSVFITKLRVIRKPHHWQFVFDTTAPVACRSQNSSNPAQIVLDCQGVHLKSLFPASSYASTPVTKIHARHGAQNNVQLTLDLDHPLDLHFFTLPAVGSYQNRLIVDLQGHTTHAIGFEPQQVHAAPKPKYYLPSHIITTNSLLEKRERQVIVVIDPGHGGKDPGAIGLHGTHEKDVVLAISKDLQRDINHVPGFKAVLTRDGDYFVSLRGRLALARHYKADMFIAIHADAYRDYAAQGVSVFALSQRGATGEAARWLAARENQSELMGGVELQDKSQMLQSVLINLSQSATIRSSLQIGEDLVHNIGQFAQLHHGHQVEQAAFVVLKSPDIPSLLVETGFISNRFEEARLMSSDYQNRLAQSIANGVCEYFENSPPRGTELAAQQMHYRYAHS